MTVAAGEIASIDRATKLAAERTRVAYERTMLAWVRTSASLITFGFSVSKFFDIVRPEASRRKYLIGPREFGIILVCIGVASLVLAVWEHRQGIAELGNTYGSRRFSLAVFVAGLIALLGIVALLTMVFRK